MIKKELEKLLDNLKEADLSDEEIKEFVELYKNSSLDKQCECLTRKRKKLLDKIHKNEHWINNLDYLKFILENEEDKNE